MSTLILWNVIWSAVLAVLVFLLGHWTLFQRRPALMHLLWFGVLLRLIVPAVVAVPVLPDMASAVPIAADVTDIEPMPVTVVPVGELKPPTVASQPPVRPASKPIPWSVQGWVVSVLGSISLLAVCGWRMLRLRKLLATGTPASQSLVDQTASLSRLMKLTRCPEVLLVDGLATPSIAWSWRGNRLLIPTHLVDELDDEQWSCVVSHELAHLARGDVWFNLVAVGVLILFWWNPVAWWAWRELRIWQEASCDALALAGNPSSRRRYAETLLAVVESWHRPDLLEPQIVLGFGHQTVLTRRFEMIANSSVRPRATWVAMLCFSLLTLTFFCLPVRAEKKDAKATQEQLKAVKAKLTDLVKEVDALIAQENQADPATPEDQKMDELKTISRNNLKTIMLAMHIYHDKHGSFPPAVLYGKNNQGGKHPHSWRVALLPYLDQQKLYDSYHFDEPWDSDANKEVMAKMPDVYRAPGEERKFLHPAYVALVGKLLDDDNDPMKLQTMFSSKKGLRIQKFFDGTSNTLAVVEAKMEGKRAIQWTEPKDLEYDPAGELPKLGGLFQDLYFFGMADGSVRGVPYTIKESTLRELISPASGGILEEF